MKPFVLLDFCGTCGVSLNFEWDEGDIQPKSAACRNEKCPEFGKLFKPQIIEGTEVEYV